MIKDQTHQAEKHHPAFSRRTLKVITALSAIVLVVLVWTILDIHPLPPHSIAMATGPEGSAYEVFGKRYKILLAKQGIDLKLVRTAGGVDNLNRLRDPHSGVQIGFVEGGIADENDSNELDSLGTIGYEPIWLFSHKIPVKHGLFSLVGKRVSIGPEGSDSRAIVMEILKRNKMDIRSFNTVDLAPEETEKALLSGRIDAAILANSYASPVVRHLVVSKGIDLADFNRADAYVAIFPSLSKLTFPAGAANLEKDIPRRDTTLLATKTSLIVRENLHPALQYLLMETASRIHSRNGIFQKAGDFPSPEALEIGLSPNASHFYKSGRPFLQRYMPFWLAAMVEEMVVLLIPVVGLMYPLLKGMTFLYGWGMQRKIFLIYGELHWVEAEIDKLGGQPPTEDILTRLSHLEDRASKVRVSSKYIPMLYSLKETIGYVRARVEKLSRG